MTMGPTRDLGSCVLSWGGVDLGRTFGGCTFRYSEEEAPVIEDQLGTDPVDSIVVGGPVEFEAPLTRLQLSTIASLLAGASGSGTSGDTMTVKSVSGVSRYEQAQELIVKPVLQNGVADPDTSTWLHIFKAAPKANYEIPYNNEGQRTYMTTFLSFPDQSGSGPVLQKWRIGPAI